MGIYALKEYQAWKSGMEASGPDLTGERLCGGGKAQKHDKYWKNKRFFRNFMEIYAIFSFANRGAETQLINVFLQDSI